MVTGGVAAVSAGALPPLFSSAPGAGSGPTREPRAAPDGSLQHRLWRTLNPLHTRTCTHVTQHCTGPCVRACVCACVLACNRTGSSQQPVPSCPSFPWPQRAPTHSPLQEDAPGSQDLLEAVAASHALCHQHRLVPPQAAVWFPWRCAPSA